MTPFTFFLLLFGLWSSIHLIHRFYVPANKSRSILPTSLTTRGRTTTSVTIAGPYLRVESTAFNSGHDILAQWFSRNRISRVPATLRVVFDSGIAVSLLGMVVALAVLVWTFVQLARKSVADLVPRSAGVYPHAKRAYDSIYVPPTVTPHTTTEADIPVQLLVSTSYLFIPFPYAHGESSHSPTNSDSRHHPPTLTFAFTHKRAVLLASYTRNRACARCRAVRPDYPDSPFPITDASDSDGVPLQSLGASLTLLLPAAFVAFPTHAIATSGPRIRARIAAAGPLFSALLFLVLLLPLERPFFLLGYSDISADGLLVASVTPGSPLASHLPPGTLLTTLDDFSLANAQENAWNDYLTTQRSPVSKEPAWCLDTEWFLSGKLRRGPICFLLMAYCTQIARMVAVQPHRLDLAPKHA
jgi:S2P endopeptidase